MFKLATLESLVMLRGSMKGFLLALFLFGFASMAHAGEWINERYECALTWLDGEGWIQGPLEKARDGEVILSLSNRPQKITIWLFVSLQLPINDVRHEGIAPRVGGFLRARDFTPGPPEYITQNGIEFIQVTGLRKTEDGTPMISVARAAMHKSRLYFMMATAPGEERRAKEGMLLRVPDTFRFVNSPRQEVMPPDPLTDKYSMAAMICWACGGGLLLLFFVAIFLTRHKPVAARP